ncbi:MAG TPA: protein kinase [Candidatus Acidoferrum sp.]|nr:protein kinase [Candidatus Acidoferrum sp.]
MQMRPAEPEGLGQIEALFHAALSLAVSERRAFVEQACGGSESLRHEVLSLLNAYDRAENFIESPALEVAGELYGEKPPSLIGRQIGRYRILGAVGAGGMGEVYRALDPRLDREVAIKILPVRVAEDPGALTRFKREARAVAALSHPNILALHDFDSDQGIHYAVMELLEGETLSQRLSRKPMDWRESVEVAVAVAEGLSAAHKKGIVHRDIKPDNLFLTSDGQVKILDFGIARIPSGAQTVTQTKATLPGLAIGTIGYMAPEQLRGEPVDAPADLFSLGCVLHEMVTGQPLFARDTVPDAVAAILTAEPPPMGASTPNVPLELEDAVQRCLRKQAEERFPSAPDLALALRKILQGGAAAAAPVKSPARWRVALWIAAAVLPIAAAAVFLRPYFAPATYTESIAILPIANQTGDPGLEYVSDGITESLINSMSQLPRVKVIARTTAFHYKRRDVDAQQAGRELHVRRVLTGRIVRQGDSIGVQVDLINVADGSEVWGQHYDRKLSELVTLQESISESLQLKLDGSKQKRLTRGRTENQDAYRLYLLGRYSWNQRSAGRKGIVEKAIRYFHEAIAEDPLYAQAYVGLAEAYATLPNYSDVSFEEGVLKGKAAARKALEIDATAYEAYVALASIAGDEWDWAAADKAFRRALELNPGYVTAHQWYAGHLERMGRVKEGLAEFQRAYELDPLSPNVSLGVGALLYDDHQYDRAIEQDRRTLELAPGFGMAYLQIGLNLLAQGKNKEALVEFEHAHERMSPASPFPLIGYVQARSGNRQAALDMLRQIGDPAKRHRGAAFDKAVLYLGLGDRDQAFASLNEDVDRHAPLIELVKVDPFFEPLRSDPRFALLLRRMNLTP